MPQLGESIAEATIVDIKVKPGDEVVPDQEIIDVETNKAVMGVTTPCKGKIDKIAVQLKETYPVGAVLGYVEASEEDAARFAKQAPPRLNAKWRRKFPRAQIRKSCPARERKDRSARGRRRRAGRWLAGSGHRRRAATFMSPRVRARMAELQLTTADLAGIMGTGAGNRVTIKDLENFLHKIEKPNGARSFCYSDWRRGRDAPELDATTLNDWFLSESRSSVARSTIARSKARPGLYALRALAVALAESPGGSREINRQPRCAIEFDRPRYRRRSARWNHGSRYSRGRQNVTWSISRRNTRNLSILRDSGGFRPTCKLAASRPFQTSGRLEWNGARRSRFLIRRCCSVSAWERKFLRGMKQRRNLFQKPKRKSPLVSTIAASTAAALDACSNA